MTNDQKLDILEAGMALITGLTDTKRDDQALDVLRAVRSAARTVNQGTAGAADFETTMARLRSLDQLVAHDDDLARAELRRRFPDDSEGGT